jgi:hypothetical protein
MLLETLCYLGILWQYWISVSLSVFVSKQITKVTEEEEIDDGCRLQFTERTHNAKDEILLCSLGFSATLSGKVSLATCVLFAA